MKILGIETSCDETAAAVVEDGVRILSNVVVSQIDIFAAYGGVIPEVAARSHLEAMMPVVDKALDDAGCGWEEIDAIAVTYAPGLLGSLLIGTLTARTLAILHQKPLYAVHHLKSHVYANWLVPGKVSDEPRSQERFVAPVVTGLLAPYAAVAAHAPESGVRLKPMRYNTIHSPEKKVVQERPLEPEFPVLALVVSGGHTQILLMPGHDRFEIIGTTRDDAVGECFDKVAKILGLPYPGGPAIAAAAEGHVKRVVDTKKDEGMADGAIEVEPGDAEKYRLPWPKVEGLDFSFSGLKTAVLRAVQKAVGKPISFPSHELAELLTPQQVADFAASFQRTAAEILVEKLQKAIEMHPEVRSVVLAGGVAANEALRKAVLRAFSGKSVVVGRKGIKNALKGSEEAQGAKVDPKDKENVNFSDMFPDGIPVYSPALKLSGDNGAMVAAAAYFEIKAGAEEADPYKLNIYPRISIEA